MLDRTLPASIPAVEDFIARLNDVDIKDKSAIVNELTRAVYPVPGSDFASLLPVQQLPYLELLVVIAGSNAMDGISRNNAFTALNTAQRYNIPEAARCCDEAVKVLPKVSAPKGKSAGEESQVVAAAVAGYHLADWVEAGRPAYRKNHGAKPEEPKV